MDSDSDGNDEYPITLPNSDGIASLDTIPDLPHVNVCLLNKFMTPTYACFRKYPGRKLFHRLPLFAAINEPLIIPEHSIGALALNTGIELTVPEHYMAIIESCSVKFRIVQNHCLTVFDNEMNEPLILQLESTSKLTSAIIEPKQLIAHVRFFYVYKHLRIQSRFYLHIK